MKVKGIAEVARALIASAKSRWVLQMTYLSGCQMRDLYNIYTGQEKRWGEESKVEEPKKV